MFRTTQFARLLAVAALGALAACSGDGRVIAPASPARSSVDGRPNLALTNPAACTVTPQQLLTLSDAAFALAPDPSSVKGKLNTLINLVTAEFDPSKPAALRDFTAARTQAIAVLEFTTRKDSQRPLGTADAVTAFINAVSCYAGLGLTVDNNSLTVVLDPADGPRTITSANGFAAISLPAGAVAAQSLLTLRELDKTLYGPGAGPLTTKYDQYPGFWDFDLTTPTGSTVIKRSTIAICPPDYAADSPLLANIPFLRLGHQALAGFKFEPAPVAGDPPAPVLQCATAYVSAGNAFSVPEIFGRVASLFTPRTAFAAGNTMMFAGGGVGGTVTELSPFATVDPRLSLSGGGVGGTVTELKVLQDGSCEAPIGTAVDDDCRPKVFVKTPLGTPFENVNLRFTVQANVGVGTIAPLTGTSCGEVTTTTTILTGTDGSATTCWTLGPKPGMNSVFVEGLVGNNALPDTRFIGTRRFRVTANPALAFVFTTAPLAGASIVAGTNIPVSLTIVDKNGERVFGFNGEVTIALNQHGFAGATPTALKSFASQGIVTFPAVAIQKAATGYRLSATADFNVPVTGVLTTTDGVLFDVVSAAAANIVFITTPPTVPAGASVPATVRLTDAFGNPIALALVDWAAGLSTGASVLPAQSSTDGDGRASTSWTLGPAGNELTASFGTLLSTTLSGTGTVASTIQTVNQCAVGNGSDPFAGATKSFAFYIPPAQGNKTLKTITLFISAAGAVSQTPATYNLQLSIQRGSFSTIVATPVFATAAVQLRGNNSERKAVTFAVPAILGATTARGTDLALTLSVPGGTAGRTLSFATGDCSPGGKCNVTLPRGCTVTEIELPASPLPLGTPYRKSVGIIVTAQ